MPGTSNKLKYIKSTNVEKYKNLNDEIVDLHKQADNADSNVNNVNDTIKSIKEDIKTIKNITSNFSDEIKKEVIEARGNNNNLNDRLNSMETYKLTYDLEEMSLNRKYEYNKEGFITKEIISGDMQYNIFYKYDNKGNITREEIADKTDKIIGYKNYKYDDNGNINKVESSNADIFSIATNSLVTKELNERLSKIENLDFTKIADSLSDKNINIIIKTIQDLCAKVETLEAMLPNNIGNIADIPYIMDKIQEFEQKLNRKYTLHKFTVFSEMKEYEIPSNIDESTSVALEGLLLSYGEDYDIKDGKMIFKIPLIDNFTVQCKY